LYKNNHCIFSAGVKIMCLGHRARAIVFPAWGFTPLNI